ncbi:uncharacterized protein RB166_013477 [Leptodactylus fuscus]|uniref:uncharacterized protein LOC142213065 n=1 Tax=Leptodactylus fuscus TaxID=238119 RepID=UPI003F4E9CC7
MGSDLNVGGSHSTMRLKMWISLFCLLISVTGVSFTNNCIKRRNVSVSPGESFTLDIDQNGIQDITLLDENGKDIARIEKEGVLNIVDTRYGDIVTSTNFSFHIKYDAIGVLGQRNFTASVLYTNESHCSMHFIIHGGGIKIIYAFLNQHFTLDCDSKDVKNITWFNNNGTCIALTRHASHLDILHNDYEGNLDVDISLRKNNATLKDSGNYTAKILYRNGTESYQYYYVIVRSHVSDSKRSSGWWYYLFVPDLNITNSVIFLVIGIIIGRAYKKIKKHLSNENREKKENKEGENLNLLKIKKHEEATQGQQQ